MRSTDDPFRLQRFVQAQDPVFDRVQAELRDGKKRSHWMWFIFPQYAGLGHSDISQHFAISSLEEAAAYLHHPVLGPRLEACTRLVTQLQGKSIRLIFGSPDHLKFHSCMTLFERVAAEDNIFRAALEQYFEGQPDRLTLSLI
jgi:uncharacterized protein (DUF1810 family)